MPRMNKLIYSLFICFFALHVISADEVGLVDALDTTKENIVKLDIQINEGENVVLGLKESEQPEAAAVVFCKQYGIDESNIPSLVNALEKRLPPVIVALPLTLPGGVQVSLKLYEGWNINDTITSFVNFHKLDEQAHSILLENVDARLPLVTLTITGGDGKAINPPLIFLKGQNPDIVALEYCAEHGLVVQETVHVISQEIRSRVPEELAKTFSPVRKVKFIVPFKIGEEVRRTPFYENDVPSDFSKLLCAKFESGNGCYDRILRFVNSALSESSSANSAESQTRPNLPESAGNTAEAPSENDKANANTGQDISTHTQNSIPSGENEAKPISGKKTLSEESDQGITTETADKVASDGSKMSVSADALRDTMEPFWTATRDILPDEISDLLTDDPLVASTGILATFGILIVFFSTVGSDSSSKNTHATEKPEGKTSKKEPEENDAHLSKKKNVKKSGRRSHTPSRK